MTSQIERAKPEPPESLGLNANKSTPPFLENYPDLLTVQHLRELTGLSDQTIRAEINKGCLPGFRIGRRLYVPKAGLFEYIQEANQR